MVYAERNTWSNLVVTLAALTIYVAVVLRAAGGGALENVDWVPIMTWTIGAAIGGSIVLSILWGIFAGMRDPEGVGATDVRDREIGRHGDHVGQAFVVLGGVGALVLCAAEADWFWIANTLFFGFALSAVFRGVTTVVLYRRGLR